MVYLRILPMSKCPVLITILMFISLSLPLSFFLSFSLFFLTLSIYFSLYLVNQICNCQLFSFDLNSLRQTDTNVSILLFPLQVVLAVGSAMMSSVQKILQNRALNRVHNFDPAHANQEPILYKLYALTDSSVLGGN